MKTFKVETLQKNTKSWEGQITFKPEYRMTVMKMKKRWWWPFFPNEIGVISNLRKAEKEAKSKAMTHAKVMFYKVPTKVVVVTEVDGTKTSETVWQNGKSLEQKKASIFTRLKNWVKRNW